MLGRPLAVDESSLQKFARGLARKTSHSPSPVFIELRGPLGAGKSTFARAFIAQWLAEHQEHLPASRAISPTYNIARVYGRKKPIAHLDLYRLESRSELEQIGFEHYFYEMPCALVEWPEKIEGFAAMRPAPPTLLIEIRLSIASTAHRLLELLSSDPQIGP